MARQSPRVQQQYRDIERAGALVSRVRGLTTAEADEALRSRATEADVSLHAAALAVLASSPTDDLLTERLLS